MVFFSVSYRPFFGAVFLLLLLAISSPQPAQSRQPTSAADLELVRLIDSSEAVVRFAVNVGAPQITSREFEGQPHQQISLDGFTGLGVAGEPDLPQMGVPVALPPDAIPVVRLIDSETSFIYGLQVLPAVTRELVSYDYQDATSLPEFADSYPVEPAIYQRDADYPSSPVVLGSEGSIRDQRFVTVLIRPVQYNPRQNRATIHRNIEVQVDFLYPNGAPELTTPRPESPTFERILANSFINSAQASQWRRLNVTVATTPRTSPCMDGNSFRITVTESGIHELDYAALTAAGLPGGGGVADSKLRMCYLGDEIDIFIDNQNGLDSFGAGDAILFFAEELHTQETDKNIYWLTYSSSGPDGQRMATAPDAPGGASSSASYQYTERLEEDIFYRSTFPMTDENDHWYWNFIYHGPNLTTPTTHTVTFNIDNMASGTYTIPLSVNAVGHNSYRDHTFKVEMNGALLGTASFRDSGRTQTHTFDFVAASSQVQEGSNILTLEALENGVPGQEHFMWIDWVDIGPRRAYVAQNGRLLWNQPAGGNWSYAISGLDNSAFALDVTDSIRPKIIPDLVAGSTSSFEQQTNTPARYAITADYGRLSPESIERDTMPTPLMQDGSNHADYIFISTPDLLAQLLLLTAHRESQGYTVAIYSVQDIFDEFSYGIYDTAAIQRFLAYSYSAWNPSYPAPSYVNLVGESSYDHRDVQGLNGATGNQVPTYLKSGVDHKIGETAADNQYVNFDSDLLPEMHIGRLPAETDVDLAIMVDRIITYETMATDPAWMGSHLFVADNAHEVEFSCDEDPAGDFFATVDDFLVDVFPESGQRFSRLYYAPTACYPNTEYPVYQGYFRPTVADMQIDIATEFSIGHTFVTYTGHSGSTFWSKDGTGFLNPTLVHGNLFNGSRTPIMLSMTCLTGSYHRPEFDSLDEELLKRANGGVVAAYSPTGLQVQQGHDFLIEGFYDGIYQDDYRELAEAVFAAKFKLYSDSIVFQDLHDTFMLLGDPTTQIRLWQSTDSIYLPTVVGH